MPTRENVVPGNWASVKGGKWHLLPSDSTPQSFRESVKSLCAITFEAFNVTGGDAPPTNDHYICRRCVQIAARLEITHD